MTRKVPTWSRDQIQASLAEDIHHLAKLAVDPQCQWAPAVLTLTLELHTLANAEPLNVNKLQEFTTRASSYIVAQRLKGCGSIVWLAEDLIWLAKHPSAAPPCPPPLWRV